MVLGGCRGPGGIGGLFDHGQEEMGHGKCWGSMPEFCSGGGGGGGRPHSTFCDPQNHNVNLYSTLCSTLPPEQPSHYCTSNSIYPTL